MKLKSLQVRESEIESYLVKKVKGLGGIAYKFSSPAHRSVPDRLVIFPGPKIVLIELKTPGKKTTPAQAKEFKKLSEQGCLVYTSDSKKAVVIFQGPKMVFVELKAPGKTATTAQAKEHEKLTKHGCLVYTLDSKKAIDDFLIPWMN